MSGQLVELAKRRAHLLDLAAQQRSALARGVEPWRPRLALADQSIATVRYMRRHPHYLAGVMVALVVFRPARTWMWLERAFLGWQILQSLDAPKRPRVP